MITGTGNQELLNTLIFELYSNQAYNFLVLIDMPLQKSKINCILNINFYQKNKKIYDYKIIRLSNRLFFNFKY